MPKPHTRSVTIVPRTRRQRSPQPASIEQAWPTDATAYHATPATSSDHIGRFPTIGIDTGHIPGTRPDQSSITQR